MNPIDTAIQIAAKAHAGALDKDGYPVILHPLTVGLMGSTDEEKMAGFLHDVVEDTEMTFDDLLEAGIPVGVVNALRLLTHDKSVPYMEYVQGIIDSRNPIAIMVKKNDLTHNYARGKDHPELQAKHGPALELVTKAVEEFSRVRAYVRSEGCATAIFACGCFWGTQHHFSKSKGVLRTFAGYTGGSEVCPSYVDVRSHNTHHVEAVIVEYDPALTDYETLCKLFFEIHDPAQTDGVGPDLGPQYRSCIFYADDAQKATAESLMAFLRSRGYEVNTLLLPAGDFYVAEDYHQDYYSRTGGDPYCHIRERKF